MATAKRVARKSEGESLFAVDRGDVLARLCMIAHESKKSAAQICGTLTKQLKKDSSDQWNKAALAVMRNADARVAAMALHESGAFNSTTWLIHVFPDGSVAFTVKPMLCAGSLSRFRTEATGNGRMRFARNTVEIPLGGRLVAEGLYPVGKH